MQRANILTLMLSIVMVSGLVLINFSTTDSFAEKGGNGKSQGTTSSCDKDKKGNAAEKNPHCDPDIDPSCDTTIDADCDGIPNDGTDLCPDYPVGGLGQLPDDKDGDGWPDDSDPEPCIAA